MPLISEIRMAAILALVAVAQPAGAEDAGLYDKPIDPNSSFIRILDLQASSAVIAGSAIENFEDGISPYVNVKPGDVEMSVGSKTTRITAEPGKYYTYAWSDGGAQKLYVDPVKDDPSKAQVYLYNLSDLPAVDLVVPAAKAVAIKAVATGEAQSVSLRAPLSIGFAIQSGGRTVAETADLDLKRRSGFTIVLAGSSGTYRALATENHLNQ
jgi:alginate O-acetyltransferase complex protein AlgF